MLHGNAAYMAKWGVLTVPRKRLDNWYRELVWLLKTGYCPLTKQSPGLFPTFTGHNTLRRHLFTMGQINSVLCTRCGTREETSARVLNFKPWLHADTQIWAPFLNPEDVRSLSMGNFSKWTGLQWLGIDYGARSVCPEILRVSGEKGRESMFYSVLFYSILFYSLLFYSILLPFKS